MANASKLDLELLKYLNVRNVVGYSKGTRKRIKDGVEIDEEVIRIYVNEKIPEAMLRDSDILPKEILGIPVDIIQKKEPSIFLPKKKDNTPSVATAVASQIGNTGKWRPIIPGTSIGNFGITAGTFGWYALKDGQVYIDSNAHVFHDKPNNQLEPVCLDIIQPGKYDGGTIVDKIGEYAWHQPVESDALTPSTCPVAKGSLQFLNTVYIAANRRTRFTTYVKTDEGSKQLTLNKMDYAVVKVDNIIDKLYKTFDFEVVNKYKLVGKLFAGSDDSTIACKVKYQIEAGYIPYQVETDNVFLGDEIRKSGRTTGDTKGIISDVSAVMKVNYGNFNAIFDDVFILGPMSAGGDSGSSMWKLAQ